MILPACPVCGNTEEFGPLVVPFAPPLGGADIEGYRCERCRAFLVRQREEES